MLEDLTFFAMAQRSMNYLARRESVLSENIANANSPHYRSKDLAPIDFKDLIQPHAEPVRATVTNPMHISPATETARFDIVTDSKPLESKPDGNQVQIEDQMQKVGETKGKYILAANLMMKHIEMLKMAIDKNAP